MTDEPDRFAHLTVIEGHRARVEQELIELFFTPHPDVEKADRLGAVLAPRLSRDALTVCGPAPPPPGAAEPDADPPCPRGS